MSPPTRKSCKIEWAFSGRLPFVYRCYTPKLRVITRLTHPTMGRPRLYHTAEEKAKARRTNSKKHYDAYASFFFLPHLPRIQTFTYMFYTGIGLESAAARVADTRKR